MTMEYLSTSTVKNIRRAAGAAEYPVIIEIWERSVRATHDFLTEETICEIKKALPSEYLPNVDIFVIEENSTPIGFIGLCGDSIEMLFIDSAQRGRGFGSALIEFAAKRGARKVDVNEQNNEAFEFYRAKGFRTIGRDATDEAGRPYPLLHLLRE